MRAIITRQKTSGEISCLIIPRDAELLYSDHEVISEMTAPRKANPEEVQQLIYEAFRLGVQWGQENPA